ncbi:hypothetical protein FHS03_001927 [Massilia violacea]|uniref:Bro-N domain-containing protein n=1 Tax=Pseudoduganella violacea TaxID=1715466 RepID=A0A7W5FTP3_9BURK|nr:hypothetical protein [Pseudoduganella violacea]
MDTPTPGGMQQMNHVNESGMYALVLGSTKAEAKRFKRWVTSEVLPAIRKSGGYSATGVQPAFDALRMAPLAVSAAKAFGLDQNAAAISANQFVRAETGRDLLQGFGQQHLVAATRMPSTSRPRSSARASASRPASSMTVWPAPACR